MKTLKIYTITEAEFNNTEYRPLNREIDEIEIEDGWNYGDVVENGSIGYEGLKAECVHETSDNLKIWKITKWNEEQFADDEIDRYIQYIVEVE